MRTGRPQLLLLAIAIIVLSPASTFPAGLRSAEFTEKASQGFVEIYGLDFDAANTIFRSLSSRFPSHPAPPLYQAGEIWMRQLYEDNELVLDQFVHPSYFTRPANKTMAPASRKRFFDLISKSRAAAELELKSNPKDSDARYYLGAGEGMLAAFAITVDRNYRKAFTHARQAYGIHKRITEENPKYYDAFATVGVYDYVADSLPWYLKWIAFLSGFRGGKERGFKYLNLVVEKGRFASEEARVFRMILLMRENRLSEALNDANFLLNQYPRNHIFHSTQAQILEQMGRREAAADAYLQIFRFAEQGRPNYQKLWSAASRWDIANSLLSLGRPQSALDCYERLLAEPETGQRWRILSTLQAGCALDLLGRREDAVVRYRTVLSIEDTDNAHARASRFLKSPCTADSISFPALSRP